MSARWIISQQAFRLARRAGRTVNSPWHRERAEARRPPSPEIRAAYRILNFALRAGAVMLSSGAGMMEVEATILDLAGACGLDHCEADVTFTSMTVSYIRGDDLEPVTAVRVVRDRALDYGHLAGVDAIRRDLVAGKIAPEEAIGRLEEVMTARPRDHRVVLASWAGMAAAFTMLLGGRWMAGVIAFLSAAAVVLLLQAVARRGIPDFFLSVLGAAAATGVAMTAVALHLPVRAPMIVAGGIMVLVPGYALVASVQDAITGFPISGSARGLEVLLTATGIITGVAGPLYLALSLGVKPHLGAAVATVPIARTFVQVIAAGVAACLYATAAMAPRGSLGYAGLAGAGGWTAYLLLRYAGISPLPATAAAAVLVGVAGAVLAWRHQNHTFIYTVPGVMPLVPGLTIYQGMLNLSAGSGTAAAILVHALALGLAIAAGVTLGRMIIYPPKRPEARQAGAVTPAAGRPATGDERREPAWEPTEADLL